jgi:hypothetical protein
MFVNVSPLNVPPLAADFSTFSSVVTSCSGTLCALIGILSLDMVRYRFFIDYDPTFTSFTANLIGQTANNSVIWADLNSAVIPVPAAVWLLGSGLVALGALRRRTAAR